MTIYDYVVLFILIASIIIGAARGLIKEVLSLAAWVAAFWVANAYGMELAEFIPFKEQSLRLITAFVSLFIGTRLLMSLLIMAVTSLISASGMKFADVGLGSIFGFVRGCIIVLAAVLVCEMTSLPQQPFWKHAATRPTVESVALAIKPYLPGSFSKHIKF